MQSERWNFTRYNGQPQGHYESFFVRGNHPSRPLAFWIRYTIFSPKNAPENAIGELWGIYFDGETGKHTVAKQEYPLSKCFFNTGRFSVRVGEATLQEGALKGTASGTNGSLAWDLKYKGQGPILFYPEKLYETKLPAAKTLVSDALARFSGKIIVNGAPILVDGWLGSQNHNWGPKHTDEYAWGQVAGFDSHPETFLEVATAKLKIGPFWTPAMTPLVLRHRGMNYQFSSVFQTLRNSGTYSYFDWKFRAKASDVIIEGRLSAPREAFVGLKYLNPPGDWKSCLNSKIADCELSIQTHHEAAIERLTAKRRAAFEILTSRQDHDVALLA